MIILILLLSKQNKKMKKRQTFTEEFRLIYVGTPLPEMELNLCTLEGAHI